MLMSRWLVVLMVLIGAATPSLEALGHEEDKLESAQAPLFELSLGTAQSFVQPDRALDEETLLMPTTSAMFLGEVFLWPNLRLALLFNLPLSGDRIYVGDNIDQTPTYPSLGMGLSWTPYAFTFRERSLFELQLAAVGGVTLDFDNPRVFPLLASRIHLMQNSDMGVGVYIGSAFAFRVDTLALIYGVGYRF